MSIEYIANSFLDMLILCMEGIIAFYFLSEVLPDCSTVQNNLDLNEVEPVARIESTDSNSDKALQFSPTFRQLVLIAKEHQVPGYSKLNKEALGQTLYDLGLNPLSSMTFSS